MAKGEVHYFIIKNQLRLFPADNPNQMVLKDFIYDDRVNTANAEIPYHDRYPDSFNDKLRRKIRERDNYTCQMPRCNVVGSEEFQKLRITILDIHHIDYDRFNCCEKNLITLCHSCHSKTNSGSRTAWKLVLNSILHGIDIIVPVLFEPLFCLDN